MQAFHKLKDFIFSSRRNLFSAIGFAIVALSLPVTFVLMNQRQDLRQRADEGTTKTICGEDRSRAQQLLSMMDNPSIIGQGSFEVDKITNITLSFYLNVIASEIAIERHIDSDLNSIPAYYVSEKEGKFIVKDFSGNTYITNSQAEAASKIMELKNSRIAVISQINSSVSELDSLTAQANAALNAKNYKEVGRLIDQELSKLNLNRSLARKLLVDLDARYFAANGTVTFYGAGDSDQVLKVIKFNTQQEMIDFTRNLSAAEDKIDNMLASIRTAEEVEEAAINTSVATGGTKVASLIKFVRVLGHPYIALPLMVIDIATWGSGKYVYHFCSNDGKRSLRAIFNSNDDTWAAEEVSSFYGQTYGYCEQIDNKCVRLSPGCDKISDPNECSLKQGCFYHLSTTSSGKGECVSGTKGSQCGSTTWCAQRETCDLSVSLCRDANFQGPISNPDTCYDSEGSLQYKCFRGNPDPGWTQSTGKTCSNGAVCYWYSGGSNKPNCAEKYPNTQSVCKKDVMCKDTANDATGTTCEISFGELGVCCSKPYSPPTGGSSPQSPPAPTTAPPISGEIVADLCVNNDPGTVRFRWTRDYTGLSYELRWDPGGNVVNLGETSEYTQSGFTAGTSVTWYVRSYVAGTSNAGPSKSNSFTVPASCEPGSITPTPTAVQAQNTNSDPNATMITVGPSDYDGAGNIKAKFGYNAVFNSAKGIWVYLKIGYSLDPITGVPFASSYNSNGGTKPCPEGEMYYMAANGAGGVCCPKPSYNGTTLVLYEPGTNGPRCNQIVYQCSSTTTVQTPGGPMTGTRGSSDPTAKSQEWCQNQYNMVSGPANGNTVIGEGNQGNNQSLVDPNAPHPVAGGDIIPTKASQNQTPVNQAPAGGRNPLSYITSIFSPASQNSNGAESGQAQANCSTKNLGDANCDGKVDLADLTLWRKEFISKQAQYADFNKDGKVDNTDLAIWKQNYFK